MKRLGESVYCEQCDRHHPFGMHVPKVDLKSMKPIKLDGQKHTLLVPVTIYADEYVKLELVSVVLTTPQGNVLIRQSGKVKLKGDDT